MERHLNRILDPKEIVHHVNRDKKDNRIENLELFDSLSDHMSHHHKTDGKAACYDPYTIERVRKAAADPDRSLNSLGISPLTVAKICRMYGIEWLHGKHLTEEMVREALQGRSTRAAAEHLGVHPQTLYNRFDHLLTKRKSPGFLDEVIQDVLHSAIEVGMNETARRFETNRLTVNKALKKAGLWDEYRAATANRVGGPQNRKP
jgi:transposase-like protein